MRAYLAMDYDSPIGIYSTREWAEAAPNCGWVACFEMDGERIWDPVRPLTWDELRERAEQAEAFRQQTLTHSREWLKAHASRP